MKIYFAGSIRGGRDYQQVYQETINMLSAFGMVLTEHIGKKEISNAGEEAVAGTGLKDFQIYDRDMNWLREADVIVADVTMPSLGVGYEIGRAEAYKKHILCIRKKDAEKRLSAMIGGNRGLRVEEYDSVEELKGIFEGFFSNLPK